MIIKIHNSIKTKNKNFLTHKNKEMNKILYKIKFNLNTKTIHKMKKENKQVNKLYTINITITSILKYYSILINSNNLKKIKNINKWNNKKKMKPNNHLMNFLKIYITIISVNNKYLKILLIKSKKKFK